MKKNILNKILLAVFALLFSILGYAQAPTVQASNTQCSYKYASGTMVSISWTRGNGSNCMVVMRKSTSTHVYPVSGTTINWSASSSYGAGSSLGSGDNFVVYKGTASSALVYNLTPNTIYDVYVYEYNTLNIFSTYYYYNTTTTGSTGFNTLEAPPSSCGAITSVSAITGSSATINFTVGNGNGRFLTMCPNSASGATPTNGYYYNPSPTYGAGAPLGSAYAVYNNSGTSASVTGLTGATTYKVYDYEYTNGSYPTYGTYNYNTKNYISCGTYTFNTVNVPPTINAMSSYTICQDAGWTYAGFSGISDGSTNETQNLTITASSSNTTLIPNSNLSMSYTSPNATGGVYFYPASGQYGTSVITVTVNDGWSVNNTTSVTFTVTVKPKPGAAGPISGNAIFCGGLGSQTFSITPTSNTTSYTWSFPSTFTVTGGANSNNVTVTTPSTSSTGTITVYATNTNGCGIGVASTKTVQVDQQPANPYAGPDAPVVCSNAYFTNATAAISPDAGTWSWLPGPSALIGNTSSNQTSVNPLNGSPSPNTYKMLWTVTRAGSVCPAKTDTLVITADFNNAACTPASNFQYGPSSDVASNKVCVNTAINFQDLSVSANSWLWDFQYTGSVGTHTSTVQNPSYAYTSTGTYTVYLKIHSNITGLDYTSTQTINVIGAPATPGVISGNTAGVCQGSSGQYVYSISSVTDATGYNWTTPTGVIINSYPSQTSISTSYSTNATSGNISVTAANSCGTSGASTLAVTALPLPTSGGNLISGPAAVCEGQQNVVYTISGYNNATSYSWTDLGGNITAGVNSFTTNIGLGTPSGTIAVVGTNSCGNGDPVVMNITVNPLPAAAGAVSGPSQVNICPNPGGLWFTTSLINNATAYNWSVPTGATITGGNGADSIQVSVTALAGGTNTISVYGTNTCGNGAASNTLLTVNTPEGPQICMVTVDDSSTHNIIYWDKTPILHADSFRIYREDVTNIYTRIGTVHYNSLSEYHDYDSVANPNVTTKRYKISSVDSCGNESALSPYHNTIYITDNGVGQFSWAQLYTIEGGPNPVNNYVLMVDSTNTGNWVQIASTAGTQQNINDIHYANYASVANWRVETVWGISCTSTFKVINNNGTQAAVVKSKSNITNNRMATGVKNNLTGNLSVYPNPTTGNVNVEFKGINGQTTIVVMSVLGQEVYNKTISNPAGRYTIDLSANESGTYIVRIVTEKGVSTQRIIKQ